MPDGVVKVNGGHAEQEPVQLRDSMIPRNDLDEVAQSPQIAQYEPELGFCTCSDRFFEVNDELISRWRIEANPVDDVVLRPGTEYVALACKVNEGPTRKGIG